MYKLPTRLLNYIQSNIFVHPYGKIWSQLSKIVKKRKNHNEEICPHELNPVSRKKSRMPLVYYKT